MARTFFAPSYLVVGRRATFDPVLPVANVRFPTRSYTEIRLNLALPICLIVCISMSDPEIPLTGGRATPGLVRVGATVRRPQSPQSEFVHQVLRSLAERGFSGAPRFLGVDDRDREILTFLPGDVPSDLGIFTEAQLAAAARLLRSLHDTTAALGLRGTSEIICHGDPSPCNAVFHDGLPYAWIDFDSAHAGSRSDDLGYAAWLWLDIGNDDWVSDVQRHRLAQFCADYGAATKLDPVAAVLAAQTRLCNRIGGPPGNREWAEECRAWTLTHLTLAP